MLRQIKSKDHLKKLLLVIFLFLESCTTSNLASPTPIATIVPTSFEGLVTPTSLEPIFQTKCAIEEDQKIDIANNEILILRNNESIYELRLPDVSIVEESNRYDVVRSLGFQVSPNYKNIAFASSQNGLELVFSESYLKLVNKFSWKEEWRAIAGWVNNQEILIVKKSDWELSVRNPQTAILFNMNTGEEKSIELNFPDLNELIYVRWNLINVVYSQDFKYVLYPTSIADSDYINYVALWDADQKQSIATLPVFLNETTTPVWSPDGSKIITSGMVKTENGWVGQEIFLIDRNGIISQITDFSSYYRTLIRFDGYKWSPDGSKVAFWLSIEQLKAPILLILNLNTLEITDYCITGLPYPSTAPIIWSPSNSYLATNFQKTEQDLPVVILLNPNEGKFIQISENKSVLGWLVLE